MANRTTICLHSRLPLRVARPYDISTSKALQHHGPGASRLFLSYNCTRIIASSPARSCNPQCNAPPTRLRDTAVTTHRLARSKTCD